MKKSLITASASAVALAAMPVVGVFAANPITTPDTYTDILSVTIDKVCAFGYSNNNNIDVTGVERTAGSNVTLTETETTKATGTFSSTMVTGTDNLSFGTTKLGVYCNNVDGYTITSAFVDENGNANAGGALLSAGTSKDIPVSANIGTADTSAWSFKIANSPAVTTPSIIPNVGKLNVAENSWLGTDGLLVTAPTAAPKMTTNAGDYFTVTYGVKIDETQPADTYTGGIKYTLAAIQSQGN